MVKRKRAALQSAVHFFCVPPNVRDAPVKRDGFSSEGGEVGPIMRIISHIVMEAIQLEVILFFR